MVFRRRSRGPLGEASAVVENSSMQRLLDDFDDAAGTDGAATLADGEALGLFHRDRSDQVDFHAGVVTRHDHLHALGEVHHAGHVRRAEVELRAVAVEERGVAAAFLLGEDVDLGLGLLVRGDRLRGGEHLPALNALFFDAAEEDADVVARLAAVEQLAEHLDAGHDGGDGVLQADDFNVLVDLDDAALDTARGDGAAAGDGEHVLNGHQEGLVHLADGLRDVGVNRGHQVSNGLLALGLALERGGRGTANDRGGVAGELVLGEQLADLHLDEVEELLVVDEVDLVEEHHDLRHANLAGEEDVLAGLRHRAVGGGDHENGAVHLGRTRDHVLHEVGVPGAVDVRVVALVGLVLHVRHGDRHDLGGVTHGAALGDIGVALDLGEALARLDRENGGRERGFAVVNVADGADVHVRFLAFECSFSHGGLGREVGFGLEMWPSVLASG